VNIDRKAAGRKADVIIAHVLASDDERLPCDDATQRRYLIYSAVKARFVITDRIMAGETPDSESVTAELLRQLKEFTP
jgi:hypothetical protein